MDEKFWKGRSVFLTGHTGFKGGWLALWLHHLGAKVHGYSLNPPSTPCLFDVAGISAILASDNRADLADLEKLRSALLTAEPEIILHLAAQPLVRESYKDPLGTFQTNILGTAHLLEAARSCKNTQAIVCITTDKVYANREWFYPYRETDHLGGYDPYSASKAACEIVVSSFRSSFFNQKTSSHPQIATARAGNVIGGGDWALDRLTPDCLRLFAEGHAVRLRSPNAVRPWQHVLEPLAGYLKLAQALCKPNGNDFANAWNFGPDPSGDATVGEVADKIASLWGGQASTVYDTSAIHPHEASLLSLDSSRARQLLNWHPRWNLDESLIQTVNWHKAWLAKKDMNAFCLDQINIYQNAS